MWMAFPDRLTHWLDLTLLFGLNLLLQSTLIILIGLAGVIILRKCRRGATTQSLLLRLCLVGVLLIPATFLGFSAAGIQGLRLEIPLHAAPVRSTSIAPGYPLSLSAPPAHDIHPTGPSIHPVPASSPGPATPHKAIAPQPGKPALRASVGAPDSPPDSARPLLRSDTSVNRAASRGILPRLAALFSLVWVFISLFLLLRATAITLYIRRIRKLSLPILPRYALLGRSVADELNVSPPAILQSPYVSGALLTGVFRPVILIPPGGEENLMATREVFLHELAHLARRDPLWLHLCQFAKILLPFQPLLWVLARHIEELSDYACDDYVIRHTGGNRTYAALLLDLARSSRFHPLEAEAGAGIFSSRFPLKRRIQHILDNSYSRHITVSANEVMSFTIIFLCAVTLSGFIGFRGKSFGQVRKFSQTISLTAMPVVLAALDKVKEPMSAKLRPPEMTTSAESGMNSSASVIGIVSTINPSTPELPPVSDISVQKSPVPEEAAMLPGSALEAAASSEDTSQNIRGISPGRNPGLILPHTVSPHTLEKKLPVPALPDSLLPLGPFVTGLAARTPSQNYDDTPVAIQVQIPFNYKDSDRNDPENKRLSEIYEAADRNQMNPVWSPDGEHIAFSDPKYGIWMVRVGGGVPVLIYDNYHKAKYLKYDLQLAGLQTLNFSPDGKEIAFTVEVIDMEKGTKIEIREYAPNTYFTIYNPFPIIVSTNISSGEKRIIAEDTRSGSWSRDGRYFAYSRESVPELHIKDLNTNEDRLLMKGSALSPCFSAGDRFIYYSGESPDGSTQIFRIPTAGGIPVQLTYPGKDDSDESRITTDCSPDGEWILFTGMCNERSSLGVFNTVSGTIHDLFPDEYWSFNSGRFSSDGKKICYSLSAADADGPIQKLFMSNFILPSESSATEEKEAGSASLSFALAANYPNPFNMSTTIRFSLPTAGFARLTVFNIMGQKVRELAAGNMPAGMNSIVWNGKDDQGKTVSTGIYISHLQWNNHLATRRMTLIK